MLWWIANILIAASVVLELIAYYNQIKKTVQCKDSTDVSSSSYEAKLCKYGCAIGALVIYSNWVGLLLEVVSLTMCVTTYIIIVKNKPKNWKPNKVESIIRSIV